MISNQSQCPNHVLLYEAAIGGHHLPNLRMICGVLLEAGLEVTVALSAPAGCGDRCRAELEPVLDRVKMLTVESGSLHGVRAVVAQLARWQTQSGARIVLLPTFDLIASALLRRAAFGFFPPESLRGRFGGIYMRPRFLERVGLSLNQAIKYFGFKRMLAGRWFSQIFLFDAYLLENSRRRWPGAPVCFLPDPYPEEFGRDQLEARCKLGLPVDRKIFLFYGSAYRRKGLHLVVEAFKQPNLRESGLLLLFAGHCPEDSKNRRSLKDLEAIGLARLIERWVSAEEERWLFAAADFVLLPYIGHFGTSGVLSRAAGAGKPVIASDEGWVGRITYEHGLGIVFRTGDATGLARAILSALSATPTELARWQNAATRYAQKCSMAAFRAALLSGLKTT